jgi:serine protease DegQ
MLVRRPTTMLSIGAVVVAIVAAGCGSSGGTASPGGSVSPGVSGSAVALPSDAGGSSSASPSGAAASPVASPGSSGDPSATTGTGGTTTGTATGTTTGSAGAGTAPSIPDLVDRVQPSVVAILRADGAQGSGVIWSADGDIVTNNHVVEGVDTVTVVYADGRRDDAKVQAADPRSDLAVVHVSRSGLPAATFRTDLPRVGELALAIGNPLGFEESVTAGIISGLGRAIPGSASTSPALIDLIQTDAAISPGNSGGALVGGDGRILGINVAYIPPSGGAVSIGFAIPSPTAVDVVGQLLKSGHVTHAYLGIGPATLDPQTAQAYQLTVDSGAIVVEVAAGGPAAKAGIQQSDVIVAVDDQPIASAEDLLTVLRHHQPGDRITIKLVREGDQKTVTATLADLPG